MAILFLCLCTACVEPAKQISQEEFLEQNQNHSFESWKYWNVSRRLDYYSAIYDTLCIYFEESESVIRKEPYERIRRLIFFEREGDVFIRLIPGDTIHQPILRFDDFTLDSIWIKSYSNDIRSEDLKKNIEFVMQYNYNLELIEYRKSANDVYIKSDSINLTFPLSSSD